MYSLLLHLHSLLRWVVLLFALVATVKYILGWFGNKEFNASDNKLGLFFMISMDTQLLVGLLLYFIEKRYIFDMNERVSRFYGMEHIAMMILAVAFVHVGRTLVKKGTGSSAKFRRGGVMFLLSLLLMLAAIPWPFIARLGGQWI